jgi:Tol biopolymer transport system component
VSWAWDGSDGDGESWGATMSDDGTRVAFVSTSAALVVGRAPVGVAQAVLYDRTNSITQRVSGQACAGNRATVQAAISGDGETVVFATEASNLCDETNGAVCDVMRYTCEGGTIDLLSAGAVAPGGNDDSWDVAVSADGATVTFVSRATDLVEADTNNGKDAFVWQPVP